MTKTIYAITIASILLLGSISFAIPASAAPIYSATGPGTTVTDADIGDDGQAQFTYRIFPAFSGTWTFQTIATSTGPVTLDFDWRGFHSFFQVRTLLQTLDSNGATTIISQGPVNCCTSPSNGFSYTGQVTLDTVAGQPYGFSLAGSHFDSARLLTGTLTIDIVPEIGKSLVSGPEQIGIYLPEATPYQYTIEYTGPAALVTDTVPAEFDVTMVTASAGSATAEDTSKGSKKQQSATRIEWQVPAGTSTLIVDIETIESPGKGHKLTVFKPTSCGPLPINDGATAFEVDADGNLVLVEVTDPTTGVVTLVPVVIVGPSNSLEVEAVEGAKACVEIEDDDD